ncbi:hypothetical protein K474DRAFT_1655452 [Panus rudis PR-1116 ss-1]|nr:hypothetical protein K474DRAFT_1655452 [Panus rudis PR-1116 ss-1]
MPHTHNQGYLHPYWDGTTFLYGVGEKARTLSELAMIQLSAELRRTKHWWTSYLDDEIREEWMSDNVDRVWDLSAPAGLVETVLSPKQIQYVIDELAGYALLRDEVNGCQVSCFERIWESTRPINSELRRHLLKELQVLRMEKQSSLTVNRSTTDIIDPRMYCLVYGRTVVRHTSGDLLPQPPPNTDTLTPDAYTISSRFACIPTSFTISASGTVPHAKAQGYINDIDPSKTSLYSDIEAFVGVTIPLFEHVLTDLHRNNPIHQRITGSCKYTEWDEPEEPEHSDDDEGWLNYERELRQWALLRPVKIPDIPESGYPGGIEKRKYHVSLRGRSVSLLVRVTDINLQPGAPAFPGTPWHVDGMRNEHIIACSIHCLSISNMSPLSVSFRMPVCSPKQFLPGDEGATLRTWGFRDGSPGVQYLGGAELTEGHGVAFPNFYQHRLSSASLVDAEQSGSMTLLMLSLVDPDLPKSQVLTTSDVPPQPVHWVRRAVEESLDPRIPSEIVEDIFQNLEGLMSDGEARTYADEMRKEREQFWMLHDQRWCCLPFDIWSASMIAG